MNKRNPKLGDFKCVFDDDMSAATIFHYAIREDEVPRWYSVTRVTRRMNGEVVAQIFNTDAAGKACGQVKRGKRLTAGAVGARFRFFSALSKATLAIRDAGHLPHKPKTVYTTGGPCVTPTVMLNTNSGPVTISAAA